VDQLLTTKLFIPQPRPDLVSRLRLIKQLNEGLHCKLTLISAPAGFGKTTLVSEWISNCGRPVAWLSLDVGDNDLSRFLAYFIAALQTVAVNIGAGVLGALQSPQPPPAESILTTLLNEITAVPDNFLLVLDDYHVIDSKPVDQALTFLVEHLPPQMHLVIATREDPHLPLARLRARDQLTELRAADLRFSPSEAAEFLNRVMGLNLTAEDIAALETRTEGWIAGLQLAALSMQGQEDTAGFIKAFTGSHHFVLDYLVEEVLQYQSESVQTFLLRTSILERLCGPLCDAVVGSPYASGQKTLEYLEHANLFIVPLDNERHWYRYHHLFGDLLRQRLHQGASSGNEGEEVAEYHIRASQWYEDHALDVEAFQHAVVANDVERAERLIAGGRMPLHFPGVATSVLDWLASLPKTVLDTRPSLWVRYAKLSMDTGQSTIIEEKLQAAEAALTATLQGAEPDDKTRDLIGQIAAVRSNLAWTQYQVEIVNVQARRALEYLDPDNLYFRFTAIWTLGFNCFLQGDRAAAGKAFTEALSISQASGDIHSRIVAFTGLGQVQELGNQLYLAVETYRRILQLAGDLPQPVVTEAYRGLAQIYYEWNDLDTAENYGQQSLKLARQYDKRIDRFIISEVFLARLKLARRDVTGAAAMLAETEQSVRQFNYVLRMPEVAAAQVKVLLKQGNLAAAAELAQTYDLPISRARVLLAQGNPSTALALLVPFRQQMEEKDWQDERLKAMVLQAVAYHTHGDKDKAVQVLDEALTLAQPGGFIRIFVDEGASMAQLLLEAASHSVMQEYIGKLLAAFDAEERKSQPSSDLSPAQPLTLYHSHQEGILVEPLSQRESEILQLIAQGRSNREIGERLFLALNTVKGHNRKIFDKLQVQNRTEAVARARELGLL
jgi:LuxR family maltose regulon positive regulatory protein